MTIADYIVVGGGLTGCVIASRLRQKSPSSSVTLIEAGKDVSEHPLTQSPLASFAAHRSDLDWAYSTTPQPHLGGRICYNAAAKALGGGTAINYGTWTRGPAADFDHWARTVGDSRWSYKELLPYFLKTESHFDTQSNEPQHGTSGPIHTASVRSSHPERLYPLRGPLRSAWKEVGVDYVKDGNAGSPLGMADLVENWHNGKRQIASKAYDLSGVSTLTDSLVHRIIIKNRNGENTATGVQLANGTTLRASKEIIVCAGAYRTPQIMMLSGIGPASELDKHSIPLKVHAPAVGTHFHDHFAVCQWWKLRDPSKGQAIGTPLWTSPGYSVGIPCDWVVTGQAPTDVIKAALIKDSEDTVKAAAPIKDGGGEEDHPTQQHPLLRPDACHTETIVAYAPAGAGVAGVEIPTDGTHIASAVLGLAPTSRGSIGLRSARPEDPPAVDPNYYATEADRVILRAGIRQVMNVLLETAGGRAVVEGETPPAGMPPLTALSADAEIDERVKRIGNTFFHAAGSMPMGKAVDTELKVCGVGGGLRVADASIFPVTVAAHYQACLYAIAEKAVDIILAD